MIEVLVDPATALQQLPFSKPFVQLFRQGIEARRPIGAKDLERMINEHPEIVPNWCTASEYKHLVWNWMSDLYCGKQMQFKQLAANAAQTPVKQ